MKRFTRRETLKHSVATFSAVRAVGLLPSPLRVSFGGTPEAVPPIQDPRLKALAQRAMQAAQEAGATYADIRLTATKIRGFNNGDYPVEENEFVHAGVRAFIQGYWGFAAGAVWNPEEMVRLGRAAAEQAKVNALGKPREVQLAPARPITDGHWETPVKIEGFSVHPQEVRDVLREIELQLYTELRALDRHGKLHEYAMAGASVRFQTQEKAFASTDGSYCTQRLHRIHGTAKCWDEGVRGTAIPANYGDDDEILSFAGAGWEHIIDAPLLETVRRRLQETIELSTLPVKEVDIGRHDTVFNARSVSRLVSGTLGAATELDRALGYEANASGTSYLADPDTMLGQFTFGTPLLTVTANRTEKGGVATTKWDDDGVETSEVPLIQKGVLQHYQSSREGAGWLTETATRLNRPVQTPGFVCAPTAIDTPLIHTGNLVLESGDGNATQPELEAQLGTGISILGMTPQMDFQCLNGAANDLTCVEIKGGKRVARIGLAGILFRTPELWKNVAAIGGAASARRWGFGFQNEIRKGEPVQYGAHSVTAVPILVKNVSFINAVQR